jgi:hypothetical protein
VTSAAAAAPIVEHRELRQPVFLAASGVIFSIEETK